MLGRGNACRQPRPLFPPKLEKPLFEPGENRRMLMGWFQQPPVGCAGVRPLMISEHDPCISVELAFELGLRQQKPGNRLAQTAFEYARQERLCMAHETDFGLSHTRLLPK